jgi:bifunctional non-homologous end joining protein LigD
MATKPKTAKRKAGTKKALAAKNLKKYQSMRDFSVTAEPSGKTAKTAPSQRLRYVIQKHEATRLHYDFRLELNGTFRSWAVTRGPSLDPAEKRLAVEVEDHPLDYGDFEGTIPKGQYGGGTVQLWDRGYWELEGEGTPQKALAKGDLKFILHGDRLHGSWVLVRMKNDRTGGKRNNWLLIKHRDQYAKDGAAAVGDDDDRSVASGRTMKAIAAGSGRAPKPFMTNPVAKGDPAAVWDSNKGLAKKEREKAAPKRAVKSKARAQAVMPAFIEPQLCQIRERPPSAEGWVH